jgi:hypothetical protein
MAGKGERTEVSVGFSMPPRWLRRDSNLSRNELDTFLALTERADANGYAFPSIPLIAAEARLSQRSVQTALASLVKRGLVKKFPRPRANGNHQSNRYWVAKLPHDGTVGEWGHLLRVVQEVHHPVQEVHPPGAPVAYEVETLEEEPEEEEVRSNLPVGRDHSFSDPDSVGWPTPAASGAQLDYLGELFIHFNGVEPNARTRGGWEQLDTAQADRLIKEYLAKMERYDAYQGPEEGEPAFDALSAKGKAYAEAGMLPGLVPAEFWSEAAV